MFPTLRWIFRWCCLLLVLCAAGIAAARAAGETICCRGVAFTALRGFIYDVYALDVSIGRAFDLTRYPEVPNRQGDYLAGWSPDGKRLAFTSERGAKTGLYVMDANGEQVRRLPDDCLSQVSWSPDSRYLLCLPPSVGEQNFPDAYLIPIDGSPVRQLNQLPGRGTRFAAASPDGKQILYDESDVSGSLLMLLNVDSGERQVIAEISSLSALTWLPENRISFTGMCGQSISVVVKSLDTGETICFKIMPDARPRYAWSPDGTLLAYTAVCEQHGKLAVLSLKTGESRCLDEGSGITSNLSWSPDGQMLAWGTHTTGSTQVWLYDVQSGERRAVFSRSYYEGLVGVRWSPDGSRVSFAVLERNGGTDGTFVLEMQSGTVTRMLAGTYLEASPFAWQPGT
jgi:Tol biopolymer transport system component